MEIVIENASSDASMLSAPLNSGFVAHQRGYRGAYVSSPEMVSPSVEYYGTLQPARPRSRLVSPEPDFDVPSTQIPTTLRRVDRSGLLEIAELEPPRGASGTSRGRLMTGSENPSHSGTLTRRIDRSGLLEAVPEVPDQCQSWRSPEKTVASIAPVSSDDSRGRSMNERQLTGAEIEKKEESQENPSSNRQQQQQQQVSPRNSRSPIDPASQRRSSDAPSSQEDCRILDSRTIAPSPPNLHGVTPGALSSSVSSPYLRRFPGGSPTANLERPTPVAMLGEDARRNRNSLTSVSPSATKFLPIEALPPRSRQSYVDLTGASYTRTGADNGQTSLTECSESSRDKRQQPDCLGRLSPRLRADRSSPLTMSAIPDVIEAHGSRAIVRDTERPGKDAPEGERAEAEGCEHSAEETLEETRVSFKAPNKILHNDNIQTLRVIILSEQL